MNAQEAAATVSRRLLMGSPYRVGKNGRVLLAVSPTDLVGWTGSAFEIVVPTQKIRRLDTNHSVETSTAALAKIMRCRVADLDTLAERHFAPRMEGAIGMRILGVYTSSRRRRNRGESGQGRIGAAVRGKFTPTRR